MRKIRPHPKTDKCHATKGGTYDLVLSSTPIFCNPGLRHSRRFVLQRARVVRPDWDADRAGPISGNDDNNAGGAGNKNPE